MVYRMSTVYTDRWWTSTLLSKRNRKFSVFEVTAEITKDRGKHISITTYCKTTTKSRKCSWTYSGKKTAAAPRKQIESTATSQVDSGLLQKSIMSGRIQIWSIWTKKTSSGVMFKHWQNATRVWFQVLDKDELSYLFGLAFVMSGRNVRQICEKVKCSVVNAGTCSHNGLTFNLLQFRQSTIKKCPAFN